jgi:hypothetical protein
MGKRERKKTRKRRGLADPHQIERPDERGSEI